MRSGGFLFSFSSPSTLRLFYLGRLRLVPSKFGLRSLCSQGRNNGRKSPPFFLLLPPTRPRARFFFFFAFSGLSSVALTSDLRPFFSPRLIFISLVFGRLAQHCVTLVPGFPIFLLGALDLTVPLPDFSPVPLGGFSRLPKTGLSRPLFFPLGPRISSSRRIRSNSLLYMALSPGPLLFFSSDSRKGARICLAGPDVVRPFLHGFFAASSPIMNLFSYPSSSLPSRAGTALKISWSCLKPSNGLMVRLSTSNPPTPLPRGKPVSPFVPFFFLFFCVQWICRLFLQGGFGPHLPLDNLTSAAFKNPPSQLPQRSIGCPTPGETFIVRSCLFLLGSIGTLCPPSTSSPSRSQDRDYFLHYSQLPLNPAPRGHF